MRYLEEWRAIDAAAGDARVTAEQADRLLADLGVRWALIREDMEGDSLVMDFRLTTTDARGKRITATLRGLTVGPLGPLVFGREHPANTFPHAKWLIGQLPWLEEDETFPDWLEDAFGAGEAPRRGTAEYRRWRAHYVRRDRQYRILDRFFGAVQERVGDPEGPGGLYVFRVLWAIAMGG